MDKLTVYTIENPIITSVKFGEGRMGDFGYNDLTVSFKYEGIHNDLVDIEQSIAYNKDKSTSTFFGYIKSVWDQAKNKDKRNEISTPIELKCMVNHSIKADVSNFIQTRYKNLGGSIASDITSILKGYMNGDVKFSWNTLKNQAYDTMRKYNMAGAANTAAQAEQTIKNYNSKDGAGKAKYLVNMTTDPTSLIGKATTGSVSGRGSTSGFFF